MSVEWINGTTAVINGGSRLKFVGTIQGFEDIEITFIGDSVEDLEDGLDLIVWDFEIKEV